MIPKKFRAWDRKLKGWIVEWVNFAEGRAYVLRGNQMVELVDADIVQFTGLHDKDGKEIYEGDVVQFTTHDGRGTVQYTAPEFEVADGRPSIREIHSLRGYECEVIGNIYQDKHLIESK